MTIVSVAVIRYYLLDNKLQDAIKQSGKYTLELHNYFHENALLWKTNNIISTC
jgi:hypothetical protein